MFVTMSPMTMFMLMLVSMIVVMIMFMLLMLVIVIVVMLIYRFLHRHPPEAGIFCRIIVLPGSDERRTRQRVQEAQTFQIPTGRNQQESAQADVAQAYRSFQAKGSLPVFFPYTYSSVDSRK